MAALQTLRNRPALLMSVIGGALLLFIVTLVFDNNTSFLGPDMEAGESFGKEITIQDYESNVNQEENFLQVFNTLRSGQAVRFNEEQKRQIREIVWKEFLTLSTVENEAKALGLTVTENDVKNALINSGTRESEFFKMVGAVAGNPSIEGYKQFMATFEKQLVQVRQTNPEMEEFLHQLHQACLYSEKKLASSLLLNKYTALMNSSFTANPVTAKLYMNETNTLESAEVAAVPYSSISDSTVTVSDSELKSKYDAYKQLFRTPGETRFVKLIDVRVSPSFEDRAAIIDEVKSKEAALRLTNEREAIANIVADSKSTVSYDQGYYTKEAFQQGFGDIAAALDTMKVGNVSATKNTGMEVTTFKLVDKKLSADEVLVRYIATRDKAQADSVLNAIKGGSKFGDLAKSLGQQDTAMWIPTSVYVERPANAQENVYTSPCQMKVKEVGILAAQQNFAVMELVDQKNLTNKYNVAVVRYPMEYSDKTYEEALSKAQNFLANSKSVEDFSKNAGKENYYVQDIPDFNTVSYTTIVPNSGDQGKSLVRWILDEAKAGDISNIYECPYERSEAHLLMAAVVSEDNGDYRSLEDNDVKNFITELVKQDKKAEMILAQTKNVKSMADAKQLQNVVTDSINNLSLGEMPSVTGIGSAEPALSGAMAKAKAGEFIGNIKGAAAVYMLQSNNKQEVANVDLQTMMTNLKMYQKSTIFGRSQNMYGGQGMNTYPDNLLNYLNSIYGKVVDHRYKF